MEPFKITCVTCQAGLSVRNQSLIGQILACPRCGSMVEVVAPVSKPLGQEIAAGQSAAPLSSAPPTSAPPSPAPASPAPPTPAGQVSASQVSEAFNEKDLGTEAGAAESEVAQANVTAATAVDEAGLPMSAEIAMQVSADVARYKLVVWSLAGIAIAAVSGVIFFTRSDLNTEATAQVVEKTAATVLPTEVESPVEPTSREVEQPAPLGKISELADKNRDQKKDDEPAVGIVTSDPVSPVGIGEGSSAPSEAVALTIPPPAGQVTVEEMHKEVAADAQPSARVARRFNPLDFDPESLTLATIDQPAKRLNAAGDSDQQESLEPLAQPDQETPAPLPTTLPAVRRGPGGDEVMSDRDAEKQLSLLIPALKVDQLPFVDCLRLFSQLSGVPVSVSPRQLLMAGITPQKKVSLQASEKSLGEMLSEVLEPLRLEYRTRGSQVIVLRKQATKEREIDYPVDDLKTVFDSELAIGKLVEQFVAPATWASAGGQGTLQAGDGVLHVKQTQQVQYQVLILLERIRLACKLPSRSRYPVEKMAGTPGNLLLQEKLSGPTTYTFSQFTPLDNLFVHWQKELGVPLLIDWPALASVELWPQSTITCAIVDQPWSVALEKILEPLGLGWRATPGGAIEITSAEKVQHELQLEVYPLRGNKKLGLAELIHRMDLSTEPPLSEPLLPEDSMAIDSTGQALLVLTPEAAQRLVSRRLQELSFLNDK